MSVTGSELTTAEGGAEVSCIDVRDTRRVLLKGVRITPGSGQRTRGIRAVRSSLVISNSSVQTGAGRIEAIAFDMQGSDLSAENCDIAATPSARSPTGVSAADSTVLVSRSRISVSGAASAVGINAHGGSLVLSRSTLKGNDTPEYASLVRVDDCNAVLANNILLGIDAGESVCIMAKGGAVSIVNNTVMAGTGAALTVGILVQGDLFPAVVNNILMRSGADRGSAIVAMGARAPFAAQGGAASPVILTNAFAGWERLLRVDYAQDTGRVPLDVKAVDVLNGIDGDPFGGTVQGNISESLTATFRSSGVEDFHLASGSACVNAGTDLRILPAQEGAGGAASAVAASLAAARGVEIVSDKDGKPRPATRILVSPGPPRGWDIGAHEYSE